MTIVAVALALGISFANLFLFRWLWRQVRELRREHGSRREEERAAAQREAEVVARAHTSKAIRNEVANTVLSLQFAARSRDTWPGIERRAGA